MARHREEESGEESQQQIASAFFGTPAARSQMREAAVTPKIPPVCDGNSSWQVYEEMVMDWEDYSTLDDKLRGPALENRLYDVAATYQIQEYNIYWIPCDHIL